MESREKKFTKGPWQLKNRAAELGLGIAAHGTNNPKWDLATVYELDNARLISKAPEMVNAIEELLEDAKLSLEAIGGCDHGVGICCCGIISTIEDAERILAEIYGETYQKKSMLPKEKTVLIRGNEVTVKELQADVKAAINKGLSGQFAFTPETVQGLLDKII